MARGAYDTLAEVYEFLVPEAMLAPAGAVAAFAQALDGVTPGARVLDCACGTGELAVGLAQAGYDVTATDASAAMVDRTHALAREHRVAVDTDVRAWADLGARTWPAPFDAVLCVGNSLTHAPGSAARREALAQMAGVLAPGGRLAVTSRNWEATRAAGSRLEVDHAIVERGGRRGLIVRSWTIAPRWDDEHRLDVAVALVGDDGTVTTHAESLSFWPFTHETLGGDLRAAGLTPASSTYDPGAGRYLVTALSCGSGASAP